MNKQIAIVTNEDDWQGLYIDGKVVAQGHYLNTRDILRALGFSPDYIVCDWDWLYSQGYLPERLDEVVVDAD